jgi:predicted Zn-ribbon and HTH transcriptional regulator
MFSLKVIDTDVFLDMPLSAQALYFHLGMRADDDGFVAAPRKIMKMSNASDDDYRLLMAKRFLIPFDSGVCVIRHWRIHNYIQNDRYQPTIYHEEKQVLSDGHNGYETASAESCIQNVSRVDTQVRLGKDRIGESRTRAVARHPRLDVPMSQKRYDALVAEYTTKITDDYIERVRDYAASKGKQYRDYAAAAANWMKRDGVERAVGARLPVPVLAPSICPECGGRVRSTHDEALCPECGSEWELHSGTWSQREVAG